VDYQWLSGSTNFAPGVSNLVIPVLPINDLVPEPAKTITLTLNSSSAYVIAGTNAATVTQYDDNDPPEFQVEATAPLALEGSPGLSATFTIRRLLGDTNNSVAVQFELGGSALDGVDYLASATNSLVFAPGVVSRTLTIAPLDDALAEGNETVTLTLLPGSGYTVGTSNSAQATLFDDEGITSASLLLEAEAFSNAGGWVVDQQFADLMGSPYLMAHGKGRPVADAITTAQFSLPGTYRLWVRTKDWTAPLPDHPGSFKVLVGGTELAPDFGTVGQGWLWQDGGLVTISSPATEIRLHDLTGFEGRCDALFFTTDLAFVPPNTLPELAAWRRAQLGLPATPPSAGDFDLVVVGGGISGSAAAIAAARQGLQVALIHDRPFPGGNASRDVRVHTLGVAMQSIVTEINTPNYIIGSDEFIQSDERRLQVLLGETNLHLFTEWRAFTANTNGAHIASIDAKHTRTGEERRFTAPLFIDSTGDAWIGYWAGALHRAGREARSEFNESLAPVAPDAMTMGTTLSWNSRAAATPVTFPAVPWATNVAKDYYEVRGDWYWEYGLLRDTVYDAEGIRDHLLQAIYGTWWNVKQRSGNATLELDWVGYIGGKRESRRLIGDYILTESDVRNHPLFPDAVVTESREIDIHYPQPVVYDFLTYAQFTSISSYWIPFRCLYSTNIDNLMMAGRCLSATHVGLGSPRVMNTGGQMGVATGTAAALCKKYNTTPRGVYQAHVEELRALMGLGTFSGTPSNTVSIIDNLHTNRVEITGVWTSSSYNNGYYGQDYLHDGNTNKGACSVRFRPDVPLRGNYRIYLHWTAGGNRATNVPVDILAADGAHTVLVNQTVDPSGWFLLGRYPFDLGTVNSVLIRTTGTTGFVIADAVALAADFAPDPRFNGTPWEDDDDDGVCNYVEWLNGTNPLDPLSFLSV
ncbi:MAG TPA: FAD-dependent oxidoreductase, partial [Candidatus Sulfotelmatobacter sp.]|nr:FAD-dependent oxidoreductase [Candidatus Sulfotelmatobacter sp.]